MRGASFDCARLVDALAAECGGLAAARRVGWSLRVASPLPTVVRGHAARLRSLLVAVLESAIDVVPRGTVRCTIDLAGLPEAPTLSVDLKLPSRRRTFEPPTSLGEAMLRYGAECQATTPAPAGTLAVCVRVPLLVRGDSTFAIALPFRR